MAILPLIQESSNGSTSLITKDGRIIVKIDLKRINYEGRKKPTLEEELKNPLNGPRPRYPVKDHKSKEEKPKKKRGGIQRQIRRQLVELHKLAAITSGPFKTKLLLKINNLKILKKNLKKLDKGKIVQIIKENSVNQLKHCKIDHCIK